MLAGAAHLVRHECGNGAADLMIALLLTLRPQQDEDEACGHRHLSQVPQHDGFVGAQEGDDGVGQELHLPHQDVAGLRTQGDLLQEVLVELETMDQEMLNQSLTRTS